MRVWAIFLRQYYLFRESPARILPLFAWVAIDIVLWGFLARYLNQVGGGHNWIGSLLGAVLLWDFFGRIMHGVATAFLEDIWSRNFLNLFASPITVTEYVSGLVLTSVAASVVGLAVMLVLATFGFGLNFLSFGLTLLPFLLNLFLFGIALGVFASALVLRLGPASEWMVWPIPSLLAPFAGVFYPLSTLPEWMRWIGALLPPSYVFEGMRAILQGTSFSQQALWGSLLLSLVYLVAAGLFFGHIFRGAVRSGLLARYSAESVG
ncbi:ABC transporter [bacterium SCN 62-11]|nr:ABC transporter permease [Candidatus Eremiobacteraeota bacterium]ODT59881.1 MAG: ABC transporter [bacterium SCN 62-11]